jgi:hypothetical protein
MKFQQQNNSSKPELAFPFGFSQLKKLSCHETSRKHNMKTFKCSELMLIKTIMKTIEHIKTLGNIIYFYTADKNNIELSTILKDVCSN